MNNRRRFARAAAMLLFGATMVGVTGQQCTISSVPIPGPAPVATTLDVELVNNTPDPVDPGLFVDGIAYLVDPPVASGDSLVLTTDCFAGTTVQTDASLLTGGGAIPSDNVPLLVEGSDYTCGDRVTFVFAEDAAGFFTQVLVNGVILVR